MHPFTYQAPTSLGAALTLLGNAEARAGLLAGGTDLLVQLRGGRAAPAAVVDVKKIPELRRIEFDSSGLRLGAAVSCWEFSRRDDVREVYPGLMEAAELIGSMQIQGRATIGGNLCNASPAADTVPVLIALGARAIAAGPSGEREIPVEDFVVAPGRNALADGELLVELRVPRPEERSADAYLRFIPRAEMDIAVVGAGVSVTLDASGTCTGARAALGAVAEHPLLVPEISDALVGTSLDDEALERAAAAARAAARPISDKRGTAVYRTKLAGVLTKRAAILAAARAGARS
jgi:CO/xanthine dehydrogenase FAD-binding subunit